MIFDHLGIVVASPELGREMLTSAFGIDRWTRVFEDPVNDVIVQFGLDPAGVCYETIVPLSERSPVRRALTQRVNILNHVAYLVEDLVAQHARLTEAGFIAAGEAKPAIAYGGRAIQFFFSRQGLLFELIEAPRHRHEYV